MSLFSFALVLLLSVVTSAAAEKQPILLGMTTALSGPQQRLGQSMLAGFQSVFNQINAEGGINGHPIQLIHMDDAYQPGLAKINTEQLIHKHKVIALVGNVGTPTANESLPIAQRHDIVFYAPYTGSKILRPPQSPPLVFNIRASYAQETVRILQDILAQNIPLHRLALFFPDNLFGKELRSDFLAELRSIIPDAPLPMMLIYSSKLQNIKPAVKKIIQAPHKPKALVLIGSYRPISQLLKTIHNTLNETQFYAFSFLGKQNLDQHLPYALNRLKITQVVSPETPTQYAPFDEVYYEGTVAARTLMAALKRIQGPITKYSLARALTQLNHFSIDKMELAFSKSRQQASDRVWLLERNHHNNWSVVPK